MIRSNLACMISSAPPTALDTLFKKVTAVWASADLTDDEASELYAAIQQRRPRRPERPGLVEPRFFLATTESFGAPRRHQCSPDRLASILRRRSCASSGAMPPHLAKEFRESARALLAVLVQEVRKRGHCARPIAELAARAGICCTTAKQALRIAERLGLLEIKRRPRPGQKNLPNMITIRSSEWRLWIEKGSPSTGGKEVSPTNKSPFKKEPSGAPERLGEAKSTWVDPSIHGPNHLGGESRRWRDT